MDHIVLYTVYNYETEKTVKNTINNGPVIIGVFDKVPTEYASFRCKKFKMPHSDNKKVYVLLSFNLEESNCSFKIYQVFNNINNLMDTSTLEDNCYAIFTTNIGDSYPYGEHSICWTPILLFFQNLFISNNLKALIRLEQMIKNN